MSQTTERVVFVDRDGVINEDPGEAYYVRNWEMFRFLPGAAEGLAALSRGGFKIFILSNQSGLARGCVKDSDLSELTSRMLEELRRTGAEISGVYYCPHDEKGGCDCRKPKVGLYQKAACGMKIDLAGSFNIGDSERDIAAGHAFGLKSILVLTGKSSTRDVEKFDIKPEIIKKDIVEAARWILSQDQR